ncbi:hypothetical protein FQV27_09760 [Paracoccus aurantiacus]|uniref:Uncharacterized protein n=1 Tax=Paracoccus aurantiacus TaxID=2599412 RepID=A0A5C6S4R0_9RHOB|nr:hypothetical protein [Paracoccus aurantiacus]TXB69237.1 hypothetical protein FQV27_09760 [Paracoccus aurantiacus]
MLTILRLLVMTLAYVLVMIALGVFTGGYGSPTDGDYLRYAFQVAIYAPFVVIMLATIGFWSHAMPPLLAWVLMRDTCGKPVAALGVIVVALYFGEQAALNRNFTAMPGYTGRAIDNGLPTIHFYIGYLIETALTIIVYELLTQWWQRRAARRVAPPEKG